MMKFASFETIVGMIYDRLPGSKSDYGKGAQTAVSFSGGYLAGILCAIVSHPADVMVSKLNAGRQPGEAFGAAMGRIYKDIGFGGLWNGLPVRIVMIGTLTGLQWMIYDYFKIFMGVSLPFPVDAEVRADENLTAPYYWRCCTSSEVSGCDGGVCESDGWSPLVLIDEDRAMSNDASCMLYIDLHFAVAAFLVYTSEKCPEFLFLTAWHEQSYV